MCQATLYTGRIRLVPLLYRRRLATAQRVPSLGFWTGFVDGEDASRATMTALGMQHVRTVHTHWDEPISGSELGEVEYAISREQWLAY